MMNSDHEATDAALMKAVTLGEMTAVGQLYLRHAKMVSRILMRMYGTGLSQTDIEDICHDTFIRLVDVSPGYTEEGKFCSWLVSVARGEARKLIRKRKRRDGLFKRYSFQQLQPLTIVPPDGTGAQLSSHFKEAFQKLPHKQREILVLAVGEGMSGDEIATALAISHTAARSRLQRARAALKHLLPEIIENRGGE